MATVRLAGRDAAARIRRRLPQAVVEESDEAVVIEASHLAEVARFLRDDPELDCKYLACLTAIDRLDRFEVVYNLISLARNQMVTLRVSADHDDPVVPSVTTVWHGAHLQEREAYDLMGIRFPGHPDLRRIFLWEGFPGHPLRKDFLSLPGGLKSGLARFPREVPGESGQEFRPDLGRSMRTPPREAL